MGDEGGFAPNIGSNEEGLNLVNQAIEVGGVLYSHASALSCHASCYASQTAALIQLCAVCWRLEEHDGQTLGHNRGAWECTLSDVDRLHRERVSG